jgi:hypothetical protein
VLSQPDSARSNSERTDNILELMFRLMEYRNQEIRQRLEKVGSAASMLHLVCAASHLSLCEGCSGNVLEIGAYIGGSTVAAAFGARESGTQKKISSIEAGGQLKHFGHQAGTSSRKLRAWLA